MVDYRTEVSYIKRGHNLLVYIPWAMDKGINVLILVAVVFPDLLSIATILATNVLMMYFILCRYLGRWDYLNGTWKAQSRVESENNPFLVQMMERLIRIEEHLRLPENESH